MSDGPGPTLEQRRARHAWEAVARIEESQKSLGASYAREAKRLPIRIVTAGLGHALAFLEAKSKSGDANDHLLRDVADWVIDKRSQPESAGERPKAGALIEKIIWGNGAFLQVTTEEVLSYMQWLTRFAEAKLGGEDD